ncbi:MAG TPA: phosphomannomutase/phosphoglucomutase [Thermoanaerobaculia bacterium]
MAGIFKAYDVRGIVPTQLNEEIAYKIGLAFQFVLDAEDRANGNTVVVGRDMREHSPGIEKALTRGLTDAGLDVVDIGLATTPMNYFAISHLNAAGGVQVTASHNPAQYNGLKFSRHGALPVSGEGGIKVMEEKVAAGDLPKAEKPGTVSKADIYEAYEKHILSFLRHPEKRRLKVAIDAANGMGTIDKETLEKMGIDLIPLYFELDGSFPNHEANPLKEENLHDVMRLVRENGADLGVAFDGDSDRAAFIDETGEAIGSDLMTALIAGELLDREPGKAVIYDLRSSRAVPEYIQEHGGVARRERVGHSFMKATLRQLNGIFGGELAGHYYFRDHSYADAPLLSVVEVLNLLRETGKPLSELVRPLRRYAKSPEINFEVEDKQAKMDELARRYSDAEIDYLDGITLNYPDWWANVRPSNTEPFLRLVLEAKTAEQLEEKKRELFEILGEPAE